MRVMLAAVILGLGASAAAAESPANLVQNADFMLRNPDKKTLAAYEVAGDAQWQYLGDTRRDSRVAGVALRGTAGQVSQTIHVDPKGGRWFHFSFRGLPDDGFTVAGPADLYMRVDFFANEGKTAADGKVEHLYPRIEQDRRDLAVNGVRKVGGAQVWRTYALDFYVPFDTVDTLRLAVGFNHGTGSRPNDAFSVTDFSLSRIDPPSGVPMLPTSVNAIAAPTERPAGSYLSLGGRWFYRAGAGERQAPSLFTASNADRLYYHDAAWTTPFAGVMSTTLRAGDLDVDGKLVTVDRAVPDNVTVSFDQTAMIVHTRGIPNHPTGKFPEPSGGNPNYIQEQDATYYIPLNPQPNPRHYVTTMDNSNHALPMGPIGIAANGVVFFNPFDMGNTDATNYMDRCCGHPNQDGLYHYHKYPVCINSPWADEGKGHSPLLGWAFDGYAVYGPYEKAGVMAKDIHGAGGLNGFNMEYDAERGWHYHVTPGKFPYIIGGYWGTEDRRDDQRPGPAGGRR